MPYSADMSELRKLGVELRKSQPKVYRNLRKALRAEADIIAADARALAGFSSRIPGTIKAGTSGPNTVVVRAGGKDAPDAAPYEHAGAGGTFRHPVYGHKDRWVAQPAHPFLHPAALDRLNATVDAIHDAVQGVVDEAIGEG